MKLEIDSLKDKHRYLLDFYKILKKELDCKHSLIRESVKLYSKLCSELNSYSLETESNLIKSTISRYLLQNTVVEKINERLNGDKWTHYRKDNLLVELIKWELDNLLEIQDNLLKIRKDNLKDNYIFILDITNLLLIKGIDWDNKYLSLLSCLIANIDNLKYYVEYNESNEHSFNGSSFITYNTLKAYRYNMLEFYELLKRHINYNFKTNNIINLDYSGEIISNYSILLFNKYNFNYVEFRECLEYIILKNLQDYSSEYVLDLHVKSAALYKVDSRGTLRKSSARYSENIINEVRELIKIFGQVTSLKDTFDTNIDNQLAPTGLVLSINFEGMSDIYLTNLLTSYSKKYKEFIK